MDFLSTTIKNMPPSATLALAARAAQLRSQGVNVISFAAGELDFPTPEEIVDNTIKAMHEGWTRYAPTPGLPDLRKAVATMMTRHTGVEIKDENIAITVGAKQAAANVLFSVLDPGDSVLILAPYWVSYPSMVMLAGGKPLIHETLPENGFKASAGELADLISENRPKAVIMNSPSNPTGSVYSEAELRSFYEACKKENVFVISDEIYSTLVFDCKKHFSALHLAGKVQDDICVLNGMSKSFAMTGWRIGWAVASPGIIKAISKVSAQTTSCAPSFIQKGCAEALKDHTGEIKGEWKEKLQKRRNRLVELLRRIDGVRCDRPEGSFYVWVDVRDLMKCSLPDGTKLSSSAQLSAWLIDDCALVSVPGSAFGCDGFLRFSFAVSTKEIEEGVERFAGSVNKLKR